jgi:hypothetical protein
MVTSSEAVTLPQPVVGGPTPSQAARISGSTMNVAEFAKIYSGALVSGRQEVTVQSDLSVAPLRCLDFFTPLFGWGYHGGAPEELAIAILHDHFGSDRAVVEQRVLRLYRAFADEIVAKFARDHRWSLPAGLVERWVVKREGRAIVA